MEIQGNGNIWRENVSPTMAACGGLWRAVAGCGGLWQRHWQPPGPGGLTTCGGLWRAVASCGNGIGSPQGQEV